ncbi:Vacuolar import and degradation protein 27 [Coemansia sp. RSA 2611]|nr:Vacuolar import and degradation protein 27 [Coemansia sp. RSA 2705]KAJ2391960.1 Vacuolar import and degradation protein 27 [Coemansia sp. RSA 2611]KAJ2739504.1 Vacuolar import and degradation protein 27 [Coemansia sp. Cherry 401B]
MNALRSLGKLVWGGDEGPEQFKLTSGVLYEERAGAKVGRKCVYKDAELCIRKTSAAHQYQLVVVRALEEGEDLSDSLDDERSFLIGVELKFAPTTFESNPGFKWKDSGDSVVYEFIADEGVNQATRDAFAMAVARCAWERKSRRAYTEADAGEIQQLMEQAEDEELERLLDSVKLDDADLEAAVGDVSPAQLPKTVDPEAAAASAAPVVPPQWELPAEPAEMADGEVIVSTLGELYLFDARTGEFVQVAKEAALTVVKTDTYTYHMNVASNERSFASQQIEPNMNAVFNHDHGSLIWNYFDQGRAYSFSLVAADEKHYEALHQGMTRAAYETLNQESWNKANVSSQDYILDAYEEDVDMLPEPEGWESDEEQAAGSDSEAESDSEGEDEIDQIFRKEPVPSGIKTGREEADSSESESEESESESESDAESASESEAGSDAAPSDGSAKNSKLAVGYKHGRSFVVRGSRIGVFRHTDSDDDIVFDTTINRVDDTRGREFTPSTMMLHEQDSALVLQDAQRPNELYRMDLEYGKVVEEWKVHEDVPTVAVAPNTKYSQMTGDKTLVGLSHNMLYRIDPRLGGDNLIVQSEQQAYTTKSHFTTAAATDSGAVAVGSAKGEIRLFDRLGVRAKTVLPALGEPILGIDVTSDGRYVVATCKTYLLLIDTKLPGDAAGRTGFQKAFPQAQKPAPKRLQLKPEHVVYMGAPIAFTPAKFNQAPDGQGAEKTIVTSTGPFVITWNLRRVLGTGRGDAYHIKQYQDVVVADNFRFGQDRSIVVTLPNDVQSVKRSQLAKPTRESLMIRPSGGIVNAPY